IAEGSACNRRDIGEQARTQPQCGELDLNVAHWSTHLAQDKDIGQTAPRMREVLPLSFEALRISASRASRARVMCSAARRPAVSASPRSMASRMARCSAIAALGRPGNESVVVSPNLLAES